MEPYQFFALAAAIYTAPHLSNRSAAFFAGASLLTSVFFIVKDYLK
jgi:hypothetical protein